MKRIFLAVCVLALTACMDPNTGKGTFHTLVACEDQKPDTALGHVSQQGTTYYLRASDSSLTKRGGACLLRVLDSLPTENE